jgi:hypothetical protein
VIHTGIDLLTFLGRHLEFQPHGLGAWRTALELKMTGMSAASVREVLIASWLKVRNKRGRLVRLRANRAQREYERRCSERNIILKARQMGMTTWVAARFFIHTITRPGTLSVQVAHDQRSAEEIFRIVHRFLENLPETVRQGALNPSRVNVRQIVFPSLDSEYRVETAADPNAGRGLTIQNLHCSEVARWPRDGAETLASLRAAVPPGGEVVLEPKFRDGLGKVIDGTVQCLNASVWAKAQ